MPPSQCGCVSGTVVDQHNNSEKNVFETKPNPPAIESNSTTLRTHRSPPLFESYNCNTLGIDVPEEDRSLPVLRLLYFWVDSVVWRGFLKGWRGETLKAEDMLLLPSDEEATVAYASFASRWEREIARVEEVNGRHDENGAATATPRLFWVLLCSYKKNMLLGAVGLFFSDATNFVAPFFLRELINWLTAVVADPASTNQWEGYVWAVAIVINQFLISFSLNTSRFYTTKAFCQMKSAVSIAVFEKASRLEADTPLSGKAVQLHTTDVTKFVEMSLFFQQLWASTFLTMACLIALYYFIGWAGVLAIGCVVIFVPIQAYATSRTALLRESSMQWADKRLQALGEMLSGIRIVKFMGWEGPIEERIKAFRAEELRRFKAIYFWRSVLNILLSYQPPFITFGVFAVAYALGEAIDPYKVFPTVCMLAVLSIPMMMFPFAIAKLVDLRVSLARIGSFLSAPEKSVYLVRQEAQPTGGDEEASRQSGVTGGVEASREAAIILRNVTCQYMDTISSPSAASPRSVITPTIAKRENDNASQELESEATRDAAEERKGGEVSIHRRDILANITLTIPTGKLTVIIGPTGCGKSTLISAMMGEALIDDRRSTSSSATVIQRGTVAYVPQESWMMNATVRDNILMGKPFDEELYIKTVKACQLMADLKQLKGSDMTEIGERGINVSGGQKQRVAFARAVYSDRDIVVMDDPLSAVDAHVASALFDHCICGALANKTRVLVTHQVQFLPRADTIIVMGDRCIEFVGTYAELMASPASEIRCRVICNVVEASEDKQCEEGLAFDCCLDKRSVVDETTAGLPVDNATNVNTNEQEVLLLQRRIDEEEEEITRQKTNDTLDAIPEPEASGAGGLMSEEQTNAGGIDPRSLLWFYRSQGVFAVFLIVVFFSLWRAVGIVTDLSLSWWSTKSDVAGYTNISETQYLQWFGIFAAIQFVMLVARQVPFVVASWQCAKAMHEAMVKRLLKAPMRFYDTTPAGRILSRFSKDTETIDLVLPEGLNYCYSVFMMLIGVFALIVYASRWLLIMLAFVVVGYVVLWRFYTVTNRAVKRIESTTRSPLATILTQTISGLATIRAYGCLSLFDEMNVRAINAHARATCTWRATSRWAAMRVDAISCIVVAVVCMVACKIISAGETVEERTQSLTVFSLAVTYSITISGSVSFLLTLATDVESFLNSAERCYEYAFDVEQEVTVTYLCDKDTTNEEREKFGTLCHDEVNTVPYGGIGISNNTNHHGIVKCYPRPPAGWPEHGGVRFTRVSLRYADDQPPVLKDITIEIKPRERVGVVGRTGSGKSTLMLALFRMVEICDDGVGSITFDGIDLQHVAIEDVRSALTIIPQDPMLFQGTIRSNLDPFFKNSDAEVWEALERVGMMGRIAEDSRGLLCPVTERGGNFSVGQRQLLCLARALLKKCKILLVDEATASVDFESDAKIQQVLRTAFKECTVLTIAHRLSTIIDSDKVLLMDHGVAAEFAAPLALLEDPSSKFHSMVSALGSQQFAVLRDLAVKKEQSMR